jgi:hypothetical protein
LHGDQEKGDRIDAAGADLDLDVWPDVLGRHAALTASGPGGLHPAVDFACHDADVPGAMIRSNTGAAMYSTRSPGRKLTRRPFQTRHVDAARTAISIGRH